MKTIFDTFKDKIKDPTYYPKAPIETLVSRMTAVAHLQDDDPTVVEAAADFIKRTSITKEKDLENLCGFSATVTKWHSLEFCSTYTNANGEGPFLEYKIGVKTLKGKEIIHRHALYKEQKEGCYYISQTVPLIRVIGDPVLHKQGGLFPSHPTDKQRADLFAQISIAKDRLVKTSGGGIAANQCAEIENPYQFAIVGVFKNDPVHGNAHIEGVKKRYPGTVFPDAMIMVNPEILRVSKEIQPFNHACLSVPSPNRCTVLSPKEIMVTYLDPTQGMARVTKTMKNMDAVVLWHEMNHILDGKTYIDTMLASLAPRDLLQFEKMIVGELNRRKVKNVVPVLTVPPFHITVSINAQGISQLDQNELAKVLPKLTRETLDGCVKRVRWLRAEVQKDNEKKLLGVSSLAGNPPQRQSPVEAVGVSSSLRRAHL